MIYKIPINTKDIFIINDPDNKEAGNKAISKIAILLKMLFSFLKFIRSFEII